jgi:cobalt-zinc-cadmium resistance protein CzcA
VALVIPLTLLFAVLGMYEFAIAASLLSLGAMDFGIIIDGSVVMTDANLRSLSERTRRLGRPLTSSERLQTLLESSKEVARPIAFGIGIILIVFLPVLTLEGVEGKMFKPMAWTFMFALIGALLIALTLSPVLSSFCLSRRAKPTEGRLDRGLTRMYRYLLSRTMQVRKWVLLAVIVLLAFAGWRAARLGGEFLPRLSEGALVLNTIRLAGISIDQSTDYNTRIEALLKEKFPDEVRHVWSRIGTAEVATDPMGTELTDIFISLKPRDNWTCADTQAELAAAMQEELADLPGLNMVLTQPIEMRLNEMISGIRTDLGIKIYGDDFDELVRISDDIQTLLLDIRGASDIAVDQLTGQPTLQVRVDQEALARHGVTGRHVLEVVEAVGGRSVGQVFEGQRQFDLVARLPDPYRRDADLLGDIIVPAESGGHYPLRTLATVEATDGLATINREWSRRLIRVQCNVVGRDVTSFIAEAKRRIAQEVVMPDGYVVEWGGQFENLERAQRRFMLVVPTTLLLVFVLLFFSMKSLRDVLLIYAAIPFALIGGVLALWLRDIPFSVSSAVGFIALSGLAVMDGQVLVVAIRGFRTSGGPLCDAVIDGGCRRLMPVLATSVTDALGFLPMALSTGVGAEVQRPLATVIIGGMTTSTLLTLFVLPILYSFAHRKDTASEWSPD